MCFMQTESVLKTKHWSGPAKNRFSVALIMTRGESTHRHQYMLVTICNLLAFIVICIYHFGKSNMQTEVCRFSLL